VRNRARYGSSPRDVVHRHALERGGLEEISDAGNRVGDELPPRHAVEGREEDLQDRPAIVGPDGHRDDHRPELSCRLIVLREIRSGFVDRGHRYLLAYGGTNVRLLAGCAWSIKAFPGPSACAVKSSTSMAPSPSSVPVKMEEALPTTINAEAGLTTWRTRPAV